VPAASSSGATIRKQRIFRRNLFIVSPTSDQRLRHTGRFTGGHQTSARAYGAATAWAVRQGLRNGSPYSKYGFDYAPGLQHTAVVSDRHNMLVALIRIAQKTSINSSTASRPPSVPPLTIKSSSTKSMAQALRRQN
jgi:hypothetical protein